MIGHSQIQKLGGKDKLDLEFARVPMSQIGLSNVSHTVRSKQSL